MNKSILRSESTFRIKMLFQWKTYKATDNF